MEEVLTRRLTALLVERREGGVPKKFAYPPQLLLVDGGKGQLAVAVEVVEELGLASEIPVAALAKQFEEVFVPGQADPIRIPASPRRCTCSSASATKPTGSPSRITASCGASA